MTTFLGTVLVVSLCCLLMGVGALAGRGPIRGGCGRLRDCETRKTGQCEACPRRRAADGRDAAKEGEES